MPGAFSTNSLLLWKIEAVVVAILIAMAFVLPRWGGKYFSALEEKFSQIARKRKLSVLLVGLLVLMIRAVELPKLKLPEPAIHDEFSYLLAADTFASGRMTNSTHPMWMHFETFHEIHQPTYMSMYPVAQGLILAAGKVIAGHPWAGVYLSTALLCAAICWMLQGWLPPQWALLGALLAVMRFGIFSYWMNSYWGGTAAAIGGVLVLGALPRVRRRPRVGHAILLGIGFVVLANSRPYEGLLLSLPVAAGISVWLFRKEGPPARIRMFRVVLPVFVVLASSAALMGFYFWRVTGSPFFMPYQVNRNTYAVSPLFLWQPVRSSPVYRHEVMRRFFLEWEPTYQHALEQRTTVAGWLKSGLGKLGWAWFFYLGPALTLPLAALPRLVGDRRMRFLLFTAGFILIGLACQVYIQPHYLAPVTGLLLILVLQATRHLRQYRWKGTRVGVPLSRAIPLACFLIFALRVAGFHTAEGSHTYAFPHRSEFARSQMLEQLNGTAGRHLVIVRYGPHHNVHEEWVFNAADIDGSKVIWAREMDAERDQELIRYFKDRHVWLLEPDRIPPKLSAYPANIWKSSHYVCSR